MSPRKLKRPAGDGKTAPDPRELPTVPAPPEPSTRRKRQRGAVVDEVVADLSKDERYEEAGAVVRTSGTRARAKTGGKHG